jgi:hypothetical protein
MRCPAPSHRHRCRNVATCSFVRPNGNQCRANVAAEGALCLFHDQARLRQAQEARSKGAASTNSRKAVVRVADPEQLPGSLETLEDAARWSAWIVNAAATGLIDARTSHELAYSLRCFIDARKSLDRTDERVKQLEAKVRELRDASARR